jgi:hypothetical protein
MIRRQRKAHFRVWVTIATLLPLALAVILSLAASQVVERAPQRLAPPVTAGANG